MNRRTAWILATALLAAAPAGAQEARTSILQAIRLPTATREARELGVPETEIRSVFDLARERKVSPGSLAELFTAENEAIRQNGRIDNFGGFVQRQLDAGLRGRDLAAAIHAEHARRGMGKPAGKPGGPGKAEEHGKSGERGKSDDAGKSDDHGKSDEHGKSGEHGRPDDAGKPATPGRSAGKGGKG